jgi:hypothetical protein
MNPLTTAVVVVVGVALLAWLLRRTSGSEGIDRNVLSGRGPEAEAAEPPESVAELADDDEPEDEPKPIAALTSDGLMFLPFSDGVELLLVAAPEEMEQPLAQSGRVAGKLSSGDLLGARIVRGAVGVDPWRLEALGRDREYLSWGFETEEAARVSLEMLERAVIKAALNPDGDPSPPTSGDYEEARRIKEDTARELAMMPEAEEPEELR